MWDDLWRVFITVDFPFLYRINHYCISDFYLFVLCSLSHSSSFSPHNAYFHARCLRCLHGRDFALFSVVALGEAKGPMAPLKSYDDRPCNAYATATLTSVAYGSGKRFHFSTFRLIKHNIFHTLCVEFIYFPYLTSDGVLVKLFSLVKRSTWAKLLTITSYHSFYLSIPQISLIKSKRVTITILKNIVLYNRGHHEFVNCHHLHSVTITIYLD